jgi:hypothetical protein
VELRIPFLTEAGGRRDTDRRSAERRLSGQSVCYRVLPSEPRRWGMAVDVSRTGLGLLAGQELTPGTRVVVEVTLPQAEPLTLAAVVVHARRQPHGCWVNGCKFEKSLNPDQFRMFL